MKSSLRFLDPAGRSQRKSYCLANARKVQQQEEEEKQEEDAAMIKKGRKAKVEIE